MRSLKLTGCVSAVMVTLTSLAYAAEGVPTCRTAEFSPAVMERFPNARDACLDIVSREGQFYAVFKANLLRISDSGVAIRVQRPDGNTSKTQLVRTSPDRFVLIGGKPVRLADVSPNQEITVYAKVTEPVVALLPPLAGQTVPLAPIEVVQ